MGILDLFRRGSNEHWGASSAAASGAAASETDSVRRVMKALSALPPERARFVAAYAYLLGRVAYADRDFQPEEADEIVRLLQQREELPTDQARLVADIVKDQNEHFGGTEDYLVTREFREVATRPQRLQALDCLFAVAAADDIITTEEEAAIAQMANELGLTHEELVTARLPYSEKRSIFK